MSHPLQFQFSVFRFRFSDLRFPLSVFSLPARNRAENGKPKTEEIFVSRGGKGRAMATSVTTRAAGTLNPTRQQLDELDALLQRMLELPVQPLEKPEQTHEEEPAEEPEPPPPPRQTEIVKKKEEKEAAVLPHNVFRLPASATPPVSYTVVETASPRPLPPASGFEPRPSTLTPRLVPVTPPPPPETPASPSPVAAADEEETWVPLRSTWQPSASTWPPLAESWHQANGGTIPLTAPEPIADSRPDPTPPMPAEPIINLEKPAPLPVSEPVIETPNAEVQAPSEPRLSLSADDAPIEVAWPLLPLVWFNQGFDACVAPLGAPGRWLCGRGRVVLGLLGLAGLAAAAVIAVNSGMAWSW
jgi:hypothetical protein